MIKIEVTGNSIPEVADKLLAIGASLRNSSGVWWEATDAPHKLAEKLSARLKAEVADEAPVDPTPAPKSAPPAETTEQPSSQPSDITPPSSASELSFETDVTPVVLAVVQAKGKPAVEEILSQFGVARASQLDPARWPELVAALKDQL